MKVESGAWKDWTVIIKDESSNGCPALSERNAVHYWNRVTLDLECELGQFFSIEVDRPKGGKDIAYTADYIVDGRELQGFIHHQESFRSLRYDHTVEKAMRCGIEWGVKRRLQFQSVKWSEEAPLLAPQQADALGKIEVTVYMLDGVGDYTRSRIKYDQPAVSTFNPRQNKVLRAIVGGKTMFRAPKMFQVRCGVRRSNVPALTVTFNYAPKKIVTGDTESAHSADTESDTLSVASTDSKEGTTNKCAEKVFKEKKEAEKKRRRGFKKALSKLLCV